MTNPLQRQVLFFYSYHNPPSHFSLTNLQVRAILKPLDGSQGSYEFEILSYNNILGANHGMSHCKGILKRKSSPTLQMKYARVSPMLVRKKEQMVSNTAQAWQEILMKRAMYEMVFTRVVTYSEPYQRVQSIRIDGASGDTHAVCQYPDDRLGTAGLPAANAIFMDVLLHVAGFAANIRVGTQILCMCKEVTSATVLRSSLAPEETFEVYCK
jgi:hypothetical protein